MLDYQIEAARELLQPKSSLMVMGRGLGLLSVQAQALKELMQTEPRPLILLINYTEDEIAVLRRSNLVVSHVDEEKVTKTSRKLFYEKKGLLSFSSKMVVVDLLESVLDPRDVSFLYINDISHLSTSSNERFLAELCMIRNQSCYAKLFSEKAEQIDCQFESLNRLFFLQHISLWPRTRPEVDSALSIEKTQVTQVLMKPTKAYLRIQTILTRFCEECICEIKRINPQSLDQLTFEACLLRRHRRILKQTVDSKLKNLSSNTLVLLENIEEIIDLYRLLDLGDGPQLFQSFLQIIETNRDQESSIWLNTQNPGLLDELNLTFRGLCFTLGSDGSLSVVSRPPRKWTELAKSLEMCTRQKQWGSVLIYVEGLLEDLQYFLTTAKMGSPGLVPDLHFKTLLEVKKNAVLTDRERCETALKSLESTLVSLQAQFCLSPATSQRADLKRRREEMEKEDDEANLRVHVLESMGYKWSSEYCPGWRVTVNENFDPLLLDLESPTHIILFSTQVAIVREVEQYIARLELSGLPQPQELIILMNERAAETTIYDSLQSSEENAFSALKRRDEVRVVYRQNWNMFDH